MLDKLPPEICAHIFDFACTDSGRTERSLGRVSRYIRQTSELARYTNIALVGRAQTLGFAQFLAEHTYIRVKTRRLFISGKDSKKELKSLTYPPSAGGEHALCREVASAVERILSALGPSLEVLDISLNEYVAELPVQPISLPHLVDLTTRCDFPFYSNDLPLLEPTHSLRYLHVVDSRRNRVCVEEFFENGISYFAPSLTHLRLSQLHGGAISELEYALDPSRVPPSWLSKITHLPATMELVLLKPAVERNYPCACGRCDYCDDMDEYGNLMERARELRDKDRRVVLLKADSTRPAKGSNLQEWLDGGAFDWDASDLDLKVGRY
ncbi:hypothetical protein MSAN_01020900 [Mycena sanguinolenta]|uniref:Uncharacterized protein n=1 Tax=Mycena sanguinolenta TaxID=230812 RepID=A0A8H6YRP2_9AGAR|nr:hypothetical protein MSAN_01020900 [Mycena sanguinolenta]